MKFFSILFASAFSGISMIILPLSAYALGMMMRLPFFGNDTTKVTGLLLLIFGLFIFAYCSRLFKNIGNGTPVPVEPPKELVIEGLYRKSRNPIYIGYWLILIGESLFLGQSLVLLYAILFIFTLHLYIVFVEEKELVKRFGDDYKKYLQKVPRYF